MSKLEAVSITKSFGDNTILQDVSLRLEPREIVCLLGVSGGGKTTLFNVLSGLTMMAIPYAVTGVLLVLVWLCVKPARFTAAQEARERRKNISRTAFRW